MVGDEHGREAIKQEMLSRVWQAVDADGNGSLDRAEIEKVLREMMGASDDGDVESTLDRLDLDGDGVLSFVRSPAPRAVILLSVVVARGRKSSRRGSCTMSRSGKRRSTSR